MLRRSYNIKHSYICHIMHDSSSSNTEVRKLKELKQPKTPKKERLASALKANINRRKIAARNKLESEK